MHSKILGTSGQITLYRLICCVAIMLLHVGFPGTKFIMYVATPAFLMLSAYLFFRDFTMGKLLGKWKRRIFTLLIPFLIWNLIYYAANLVCNKISGSTLEYSEGIEFSIAGVLRALVGYEWNSGFWFIQFLIIFTVFAPIVFILMKNRYTAMISLVAFLVLSVTHVLRPYAAHVDYMLQWFFIYLTGAALGLHGKETVESEKYNLCGAVIFSVLTAGLCLIGMKFDNEICLILTGVVSGPALWNITGLLKAEMPGWTDFSFMLYAVHPLLISLLYKLTPLLNREFVLLYARVYIPLIVILLSILLNNVLKKTRILGTVLGVNRKIV